MTEGESQFKISRQNFIKVVSTASHGSRLYFLSVLGADTTVMSLCAACSRLDIIGISFDVQAHSAVASFVIAPVV
jgi:hypothetical protein